MKAKHFIIQELVPRKVYEARGEKAWQLIDDRQIITVDALRDRYGPIYINTWHMGNNSPFPTVFEWSGLRTVEYFLETVDAERPTMAEYLDAYERFNKNYSQHKYGRATDDKFWKITAEEVRQDILKNPDLFPYINSIELDTNWLHHDCRNCERILTYPIPIGR